jgi:hypothetical protein
MATSMVKLTREAIDVEGVQALTDNDKLLREVQRVTGYQVLNEALRYKYVAEIFDNLGIEPFNDEKVKMYKAQMAKQNTHTRTTADQYRVRTVARWVDIPLRDYKRAVPAFALLRATQVQKALNKEGIKGELQVEELTIGKTREYVDPFMVLVVGDRRFYLDVWDEPKFEGRRTK